jgi:hypothetical protein
VQPYQGKSTSGRSRESGGRDIAFIEQNERALEDLARIALPDLGSVIIEIRKERVSLGEVCNPTAWPKKPILADVAIDSRIDVP